MFLIKLWQRIKEIFKWDIDWEITEEDSKKIDEDLKL